MRVNLTTASIILKSVTHGGVILCRELGGPAGETAIRNRNRFHLPALGVFLKHKKSGAIHVFCDLPAIYSTLTLTSDP